MSIKRDYKPASSWKNRRRLRLHGLIVIVLVLVGLAGALVVYLSQDELNPLASADRAAQGDAYTLPENPPAPPKPKYDFYEVLPEQPLIVPQEDEEDAARNPQQPPRASEQDSAALPSAPADAASVRAPQPANKPSYFVQAGSFRGYSDADRRKASLAMMGISAQIHTFTRDDGTILHRVRIGPIDDRNEVETLRQRLSANDIPSIAITSN